MFLREHRQRRRRKRGDAVGSWRTFSKQLPLDLVWNLDWNALSLKHNRGSVMQGLEFEVFFKAQLHKFGRVDGEDQLAEAEWPAKQGKARQAKPSRIDIYRWSHDWPSFQIPSDTQWHVRTSVSDTVRPIDALTAARKSEELLLFADGRYLPHQQRDCVYMED